MTERESELAWRLADYQARGIEPPALIERNPTACEGELMTDAEVAEYIDDSLRVIYVLTDQKSPRLGQVKATFRADLKFLLEIGRLSLADYHEIIEPDNF